ncbi:MAG: homoserine kinase [Methylococcales bacterium]|nr:homoserine kinase [Methylococcales bacterium]
MSVYTQVSHLQLDLFFSRYELGKVISFEGINDGIDNTNYFINTTQGHFVLTLFETLAANELIHVVKLLLHLVEQNIPCPIPQPDRQTNLLRQLNNKPAAVFKRIAGAAIISPSVAQCREVGLQLAKLHLCTKKYIFPLKNNNGLDWCKKLLNRAITQLSSADRELISDELLFQTNNRPDRLPQGVIHGDLFRDNVLFTDNRISGILDFYSACTGALLFDIAITANDWCCEQGNMNHDKFAALLSSYQSLRPLEPVEKQHLHTMLRAAALRFWLSRLEHQLYSRPAEITRQKDPLIFWRLLQQYRQQNQASLFQPKALSSYFQPDANNRRRTDSGDLKCGINCKSSS